MFNQKCDWLNVKADDWTLNISADTNYEESRTFKICLSAGDYFDYINGTQEELMTGGGTPINLKAKTSYDTGRRRHTDMHDRQRHCMDNTLHLH